MQWIYRNLKILNLICILQSTTLIIIYLNKHLSHHNTQFYILLREWSHWFPFYAWLLIQWLFDQYILVVRSINSSFEIFILIVLWFSDALAFRVAQKKIQFIIIFLILVDLRWLLKCKISIPQYCYFCFIDNESVNHLCFECLFTFNILVFFSWKSNFLLKPTLLHDHHFRYAPLIL